MLVRRVTQMYAILVGGLALAGLLTAGHLFDLMNVDMALDLTRVVLAIWLFYAGFVSKDEKSSATALLAVGILYVGMGIIALASPTFSGLLPSGLTGFDVVFHLFTGVAAIGVASTKRRETNAPAHS